MEINELELARQNSYTSYPSVVDLPCHVKPSANYPPKLPTKLLKSRHSSALSVPARTIAPFGSLLPLKVVLHAGKPSSYMPPPTYAKTEKERKKIEEEDRVKVHGEMGFLALQ